MKTEMVINGFKSMVNGLCEECEAVDSLEKLNSLTDQFDGARKTIVCFMFYCRPETEDLLYPVLADARQAFKNARQAAYDRLTKI